MSGSDFTISINQGATYEAIITWNSPSKVPINLTDYTAKLTIAVQGISKLIITDSVGVVSNGAVGLVLGGTSGTVSITITASQTALFNFGKANYDLDMKIGSKVYRILSGDVVVKAGAVHT